MSKFITSKLHVHVFTHLRCDICPEDCDGDVLESRFETTCANSVYSWYSMIYSLDLENNVLNWYSGVCGITTIIIKMNLNSN